MGYERYPRDTNSQGDFYGRNESQEYGQDFGTDRYAGYAGARDQQGGGAYGRDRDGGRPYGQRDGGGRDYRGEDRQGRYSEQGRYGEQGRFSGYGAREDGRSGGTDRGSRYGTSDCGYRNQGYGPSRSGEYRNDRDTGGHRDRGGEYGRQPQGYDYDERGFLARAGDEVRSWFGDEEAERRRETDSRYDERYDARQGNHERDGDYHNWRSGQIAALDRDYHEYRQENRTRFESEFATWRDARQTQRNSLGQVKEHDEVLGSDGSHVGTVDKVRGDRILLTKNDVDAGGQHHSIPSRWISTVEAGKVTLSKSADEAKKHWRDEEQNQALFGDTERGGSSTSESRASSSASTRTNDKSTDLNSSFSGTY